MHYKRFDPGTVPLPAQRVSALPTISLASILLFRRGPSPGQDAAPRLPYARSRYALTDAFRLCGAGQGTVVFAPAYHCRTMLDPAIRLGAEVRLYSLLPDLRPDLDALERSLNECGAKVVALLAVHYFGFQQDWTALAAICKRSGVALIEDCSHCLPALSGLNGLGAAGRYSVWSPYKFYPCEDGGELQANAGAPLPQLRNESPQLLDEIRGLVHLMQHARMGTSVRDLSRLPGELSQVPRGPGTTGVEVLESGAGVSDQYDTLLERRRSLVSSRWITRHADASRIRDLRRAHYVQWVEATAELPNCRALFPELPEDCVPYKFPLLVEDAGPLVMLVKRLGLPVWRWDNMAISSCSVAGRYRLNLLQLPCHQELNPDEMNWMFAALSQAQGRFSMGQLPA